MQNLEMQNKYWNKFLDTIYCNVIVMMIFWEELTPTEARSMKLDTVNSYCSRYIKCVIYRISLLRAYWQPDDVIPLMASYNFFTCSSLNGRSFQGGAANSLAHGAWPCELHPGAQHPLHATHTQPQEEGVPRHQSALEHFKYVII